MFVAHLPVGYLLGIGADVAGISGKWVLAAALFGAIFPDFDLFYFYLVDHCQHHHHSYWIHFPVVWLGLVILFLAARLVWSRSLWCAAGLVFAISGLIHLLLDGIVGDIWLFAPWIDRPYALFSVPARFSPWWLNFILHWSFALEAALIVCAVLVFRKRREKRRKESDMGN